jgi:hypothetical protein
MIISLIRSFALLLGLSTAFHIQASPFDPLIGTWKVVDERTGSYVSDIVIRRNSKTEQYSAVIVKMYPSAKEAAPTTCTKCTGALKDQPIVGMEVLTKLKNSIKMRNLVKVSGSTLMMVINTVFKDV